MVMAEVAREIWAAVWYRDGGCIAVQPDKVGAANVAATPCADQWGREWPFDSPRGKTYEHVREEAAMGAPKAPSDLAHGVIVCWRHGVQAWELAHKDVERAYLARLYPDVWAAWLLRRGVT